jgi:FMN-dependent NADH-azoreductase
MANVLYITANPKKVQDSLSLSLGDKFLATYKAENPNDVITHIDVYEQEIQTVDGDILSAWDALRAGKPFSELTAVQQQKVAAMGAITDQFVAADKYIFVTPIWNFFMPSKMKAYIDAICVAGKTFNYTAEGPVGLLKNKKAFHIQASGSVFSQGPLASLEFTSKYLHTVLGFIGVTDVETVFIEGVAANPAQAEEITAKAEEQAKEVALSF